MRLTWVSAGRAWLALLACVCFVLGCASHPVDSGRGQPTLDMSRPMESVRIEPFVEVLRDPDRTLRFDEVVGPRASGFEPPPGGALSFGYSLAAYWLRLRVDAGSSPRPDWLLVIENPLVTEVTLYRLSPGARPAVVRTGRGVPTSERPYPSRSLVLPLGDLPSGRSELLVRLATDDVSTFPVSIVTRAAFAAQDRDVQLIIGLYAGVLLSMALLNMLLFAYVRVGFHLSYALFVLANALFHAAASGFGSEYLWPRAPTWDAASVPVFVCLTIAFAILFTRQLLQIRVHSPRLYLLSNLLLGADLLMLPMVVAGEIMLGGAAGSVLGPLAVILLVSMLWVALRLRVRQAAYCMVAGTPLFLGVFVTTLRNFGVLPDVLITTYAVEIGSALQVSLLSLALVSGIRSDLLDKEKAQAAALVSQREAGESLRRSLEFRLQALQAKINPHFLFNALNGINSLIHEDPHRAEQAVVKLSRLFRYTLDATEQDWVPLSEELYIVRTYLEIEQSRFGKRLSFDIQTHGDVERVSIPGLTIQPLVENCVKHGLKPRVEGGTVLVSAKVTDAQCLVVVEDDGVGMPPHKTRQGHGLTNVRERLALAYGGRSTLTISNGRGVRIEISIPVGSTA